MAIFKVDPLTGQFQDNVGQAVPVDVTPASAKRYEERIAQDQIEKKNQQFKDNASLTDAFGYAFDNNWVVAGYKKYQNSVDAAEVRGRFTPNYNPIDDLDERYLPHANAFVDSTSPEETSFIKAQVDRKIEREDYLDRSGWKGGVASILAPLLTPDLLLAAPVKGVQLVRSGAAWTRGAVEGAQVGAISGGLYGAGYSMNDPTQNTWGAVAKEGAIGTILGGTIGAGIGKVFGRDIPVPPEDVALAKNAISSSIDNSKAVNTKAMQALNGDEMALQVGQTSTQNIKLMNNGQAEAPEFDYSDVLRPGDELFMTDIPVFSGDSRWVKLNPISRLQSSPIAASRQAASRIASDFKFTVNNRAGVATRESVEDVQRAIDKQSGVYVEKYEDIYKRYKRSDVDVGSKMTRAEFDKEVALTMAQGDVHPNSFIQNGAKEARRLIESGYQRAEQLGLIGRDDSGTAISYFWRKPNRQVVIDNQTSFVDVHATHYMTQNPELTREMAEEAATKVWLNYINAGTGDMVDALANVPHIARSRTNIIPDEVLIRHNFIESDMIGFMTGYNRKIANMVAMKQVVGDLDGANVKSQIRNEAEALLRDPALDTKSKDQITRALQADLREIDFMIDKLAGKYKQLDNQSALAKGLGVARLMNYMTMMGSSAYNSMSDLARPILVHGLKPVFDTWFQRMFSNPEWKKLAQNDLEMLAVGFEHEVSNRNIQFADVFADNHSGTAFDKSMRKASNFYNKAIFLGWWTSQMKRTSALVNQDFVLTRSEQLLNKTISEADRAKLARIGIDEEFAAAIQDQYSRFGGVLKDKVRLANLADWDNPALAERYQIAIGRATDNTINTSSVGSEMVLGNMNSSFEKTMLQFSSYIAASYEQTFIPMMQQLRMGDWNPVLQFMSGSLILAATAYEMRKFVFHRNDPTYQPKEVGSVHWFRDVVDLSGIYTLPLFIDEKVSSFLGGAVGINALFDAALGNEQTTPSYRTKDLDPMSFFGPTANQLNSAYRVGQDVWNDKVTASTTGRVRRMLPFQNVFYLRAMIDDVQHSINEANDIPYTRWSDEPLQVFDIPSLSINRN